jgi:colanic acid biosynthesis glycosyl transferase WcaI
MKVLFLNRFFHPDISPTSRVLADLVSGLAEHHDIHVITSRLTYDNSASTLPARERWGGATIHRVWTSRFGRDALSGRTIDYLTFYAAATMRLLALADRGDIVIPMTDPPLISVPAAMASRFKRAHVVNWLQDVFPEVATELDFKDMPSLVSGALAHLRDGSLNTAARNVVLGDVMAQRITQRGIAPQHIRVIHNWSSGDQIRPVPPERNPLRGEWGLDGKFVVGYSGNMGRAHEFDALLEAIARLWHRPDITFLFVGGGKQRKKLESEVARRGLANVLFKPYQPVERLVQSLSVPDCHVVSLKPALEGLMVPSKLYSSLAAGRPVIFVGARDGEVMRVMGAGPAFGIHVLPDDVDGLVGAIERLAGDKGAAAALGRAGRERFEREFDRPLAIAKWRALIGELCPGGLPPR